MLKDSMQIRIDKRKIRLFDLTWLLFLGVLPFEKAALTLYLNSTLGEVNNTLKEICKNYIAIKKP